MNDEAQASEAQEASGSEGQAPNEQGEERNEDNSQVEEDSTSQEEERETMPLSEHRKIKKKLDQEAQSLRKRLGKIENEQEEKRKAQLSETEKLQEENGTLKQQLESLQGQVQRANFERTLHLPDADLAWGMLDTLGLSVEWGENNAPTNIDDIRKVLKREKPRIWGDGSANGGERGSPPPPAGSGFVDNLFRQGRASTARR